jgi:hypothetical protein
MPCPHRSPDLLSWIPPYGGALPPSRITLASTAIRLSLLTIAWNLAAGAVTLAASVTSGSLSLGGFGLNTLIDTAASAELVWRFRRESTDASAAERLERRAETAIAAALTVRAGDGEADTETLVARSA